MNIIEDIESKLQDLKSVWSSSDELDITKSFDKAMFVMDEFISVAKARLYLEALYPIVLNDIDQFGEAYLTLDQTNEEFQNDLDIIIKCFETIEIKVKFDKNENKLTVIND